MIAVVAASPLIFACVIWNASTLAVELALKGRTTPGSADQVALPVTESYFNTSPSLAPLVLKDKLL